MNWAGDDLLRRLIFAGGGPALNISLNKTHSTTLPQGQQQQYNTHITLTNKHFSIISTKHNKNTTSTNYTNKQPINNINTLNNINTINTIKSTTYVLSKKI